LLWRIRSARFEQHLSCRQIDLVFQDRGSKSRAFRRQNGWRTFQLALVMMAVIERRARLFFLLRGNAEVLQDNFLMDICCEPVFVP